MRSHASSQQQIQKCHKRSPRKCNPPQPFRLSNFSFSSNPTTQDTLQFTHIYRRRPRWRHNWYPWFVDGSLVQSGGDIRWFLCSRSKSSVEILPSDITMLAAHKLWAQQFSTVLHRGHSENDLKILVKRSMISTVCWNRGYDPDGDLIMFSWTNALHTQEARLTSITPAMVSTKWGNRWDVWECSYTAQDDALSSSPVTTDAVGPNGLLLYVINTHEVSSCTQIKPKQLRTVFLPLGNNLLPAIAIRERRHNHNTTPMVLPLVYCPIGANVKKLIMIDNRLDWVWLLELHLHNCHRTCHNVWRGKLRLLWHMRSTAVLLRNWFLYAMNAPWWFLFATLDKNRALC